MIVAEDFGDKIAFSLAPATLSRINKDRQGVSI